MKLETLRSFRKSDIRDMIIACDDPDIRLGLMKIYDAFEDQGIDLVAVISQLELERIRAKEIEP